MKGVVECGRRSAGEAWSAERVEHGGRLLGAVLSEFPAGSSIAAHWARLRTGGRYTHEMKEAARVVGRPWTDVMLANVSYGLAMVTIGCSTAALASPEGPVLARNLDWWPERELVAAAEVVEDERTVRATWPGFSGVVTGMSKRGFAVAINAVSTSERPGLSARPVLLTLRSVLEDASGFEEAVHTLSSASLLAPALFTVVGTRNDERVVIERSPRRAKLRRPEGDAPLVATNDYRAMGESGEGPGDLYATSCGRFDALSALTRRLGASSRLEDDALLEALRHREVLQNITVQHVIARPSQGELRAWVPSRWLDGRWR